MRKFAKPLHLCKLDTSVNFYIAYLYILRMGPKQKSFIQRAYGRLARGYDYSKIGPLQKDTRRVAWRASIRWITIGATLILILNIVVTIFVIICFGISNGIATLYTGDCTIVSRMDSGLHIMISLLSTALLSTSNYIMQVLNAPSRKQVDGFHKRRESLYIGIQSFENAMCLGKHQTILWVLLGISAIPLHLLYVSLLCSYTSLGFRKIIDFPCS
jgi:magnesium-transporting ATPase (P-type)